MTDEPGITCRVCGRHWDTTAEMDALLQEVEDHAAEHAEPDDGDPRIFLR